MIPFTFRQLEVFAAIVETGSFGACADRLAISQASISAHLKSLEQHLGYRLFRRRRGASAALTEAGRRTYEQAKQLVTAAAELASRPDRTPSGRRKLTIGAHGFIAERFAKHLAEFSLRHPEVEIELERCPFEGVLAGLEVHRLDLGFFISRGPVAEVRSVCAWQEEVGLYVGAAHPLAKRSVVHPLDLTAFPFAYLPGRSHLRTQVDSIMEELDIRGCPIAHTSDDHLFVMQSLSDGRSFACLFARGIEELMPPGSLKRLRLSRPVPPLDIRYSTGTPDFEDTTTRALTDCLTGVSHRGHAGRSHSSSTTGPRF